MSTTLNAHCGSLPLTHWRVHAAHQGCQCRGITCPRTHGRCRASRVAQIRGPRVCAFRVRRCGPVGAAVLQLHPLHTVSTPAELVEAAHGTLPHGAPEAHQGCILAQKRVQRPAQEGFVIRSDAFDSRLPHQDVGGEVAGTESPGYGRNSGALVLRHRPCTTRPTRPFIHGILHHCDISFLHRIETDGGSGQNYSNECLWALWIDVLPCIVWQEGLQN